MHKYLLTFSLLVLVHSAPAMAMPEMVITIRDHLFYPSEVIVPAGKKVKLIFINQDNTPEELDSFELNREKVVFGNAKANVFIGPLDEGEYHFFGEFHPSSAVGKVIVVSPEVFNDVN
ncbi:cupredoxin domain-containing protein [Paraglaciecola sp. L1A13]|uniref:cupredoxin domain-containing protein n=1 Tax=Paraglaciecola sp. L1A13 TaxID=2686359 RepID=UPI00131DD453|nr:cupredoxin domain-containing protein [Paraglaciecola sp. L1A13]